MRVVGGQHAIDHNAPPGERSSAWRAPWLTPAVVVMLFLIAAAFRLPALEHRPMHADEAVHAAKFGRLLEHGIYEYDPHEYHGPTLNVLTLIPARARGIIRYADVDEATLRLVPAVTGVLLAVAHLLLAPVIGWRPAAFAAALAAVSPAMVYYSRYYIQETLLVAFSFGLLVSICRYLRSRRVRWALSAGVWLGLMQATKETWVLAAAAMLGALGIAWAIGREKAERRIGGKAASEVARVFRPAVGRRLAQPSALAWRRRLACGTAAALSCLSVSALFFSSFGANARGVGDAIAAFTTYSARATGATWHIHPWHYYFGLLLGAGWESGPLWTEGVIVALAIVGGIVITRRAVGADAPAHVQACVFLVAYAVLLAVVYSAIPYKTPWCALGFLDGFIVLAGVGASALLDVSRSSWTKGALAVLLVAATAHLGWQAWAASIPFASDPRNPYVYAHTGTGVFGIVQRVDALSRADSRGTAMPVEVISHANLWPLPWYLRRFTDVRWEAAPVNDGVHAPVILATPDMEDAIRQKLYEWRRPGERELYVPIFEAAVELRPQVEVRGYAAKSLWDRIQ